MRTTFMQKIVTIAIFSTSIISTFATPLPASFLKARDMPLSLPNDGRLVSEDTHLPVYRKEPPGDVTPTKFTVPHAFLITPRAPPPSIYKVFADVSSQVAPLIEADPWNDLDKLKTFLHTTLKVYSRLLDAEGFKQKKKLEELRRLVFTSLTSAVKALVTALERHKELDLTEEKGKPLIELLIEIAEMTIDYERKIGEKDWANVVLLDVKLILKVGLDWPIITSKTEGLVKTKRDLENKLELRTFKS